MRFFLFVLAVLIAVPGAGRAADFASGKSTYDKIDVWEIHISGAITEGDNKRLLKAIARNKSNLMINITLDSPGGDMWEAIAMGRTIEKHDGNTMVYPDSECSSACVLVYVGGGTRLAFGTVGVHQFAIPDDAIDGMSKSEILQTTQNLQGAIALWYERAGVSAGLAALAARVPHDDMYELSNDEKAMFKLNRTNRPSS